ncbi:isochorismate synthase [Cyanobacterium stanieri LEGE 03274]|uniref:isochorismate synthase n=1 Tax=Cyanobacterium stanieri LEGE 03274 TaxID=1828756 RepID=A0ABR9V6M2_9CHRO|nr:isochorismate synthase [Cyanobacterium stanieri]MBE9223537.1 isochorismate synthase [Cyanobacterium stanieri LEGE 03274]
MPVIPDNHFLTDYSQKLQELIFFSHPVQDNDQQIVSISQEISPVDLLVFLTMLKPKNQVSFYCENQRKQEAVVAIGAIKSLEVKNENGHGGNGDNRFIQCEHFIEENKDNIIFEDNIDSQKIPYFFSSFNFLEHSSDNYQAFPQAKIFIPHLQLVKKANNYLVIVNTYHGKNSPELNLIKQYLKQDFSQNILHYYHRFHHDQSYPSSYTLERSDYHYFTDKVNHSLKAIASDKLTKIVVAHALEIKLEENFNIIKSLTNLRDNHPDCYIFCVGNEKEEFFLGASPERLLSIQDRQLVTDALAGSAPRGKSDYDDSLLGENLLNSEKEKREHQFVSDYIFEQLSVMGLNPKRASLQLLKLSNIQHLWTPIYAEIIGECNPLEIVARLHPTPAVAGIPIDVACAEIENYENFDRSLYAAPIGWLDTNGNCEFIVGIRSALIQGNRARLYAGAGIVAGSKPEQELTEIELKFQALLQALV